MNEPQRPGSQILSARRVHKSFPTDQGLLPVLNDISLDVPRGDFLVLQGASGSGKSTLLSLLAGLDRPTSGEILLDGERLDQREEKDLARIRREKVGFVFQSFHLVPSLTVLENVQLPLAFHRDGFSHAAKARELLERVDLWARADFLPGKLSGGEKQRAAIARALINDPAVVFADEPTGNLDSKNGERVLALLEEHTVKEGRTLLLVTHDPAIAARGHRCLHMKDGRLETGN
ncbi:MAG: ABC transporter ATP-binding protein [Elusimicrobia bacterium]|nr:ABC transporter ATP-binding protein [Elusimicrobiota bacterium]